MLERFNKLLVKVAADMLKEARLRTSTRLAAVQLALTVYNGLVKGQLTVEEAKRRCNANDHLSKLARECTTNDELQTKLKTFMWAGDEPLPEYRRTVSSFSSDVRSYAPEKKISTGKDYNQRIKKALAGGRQRLRHITVDGRTLTDAKEMAKALKDAWEPIWKGSPVSESACATYLRSTASVS